MLQFRKVWSSLVDEAFVFSARCQESPTQILKMSRRVAQEICMLASVAPLIVSNIAVDYLGEVFASDASSHKGAIIKTSIPSVAETVLWLDSDQKPSYLMLDNPFRAVLRGLGEFDGEEELPAEPAPPDGPFKAPLMYYDFVEICGGAGKITSAMSSFGFVCAPVLDLSASRHYDLASLRLLEWTIYMIEGNRFKSFFIEPPCTTFSPAAHPAVRSYREPLGFDRSNPKTLHGNILAFRALVLLRVGRRCFRPCGLEQSRLSKMCWLTFWRTLLSCGFSEAVIASCMFQSIHRKEFRLLCYLLDTDFLDVRCCGGHTHVRIEGAYTKPSATYTDGVALHIAEAFRRALRWLSARENLEPDVAGHESVLANDLMVTSKWTLVRDWFWKRAGHINVLETSAAVSNLVSLAARRSSVRFCHLVDSAVARGALTKGRSPSRALQPLMKKAGAVCICADLYPAWGYTPTRLNVADDPTRCQPIRQAHGLSLVEHGCRWSLLRLDSLRGLRRFAANWARLVLLVSLLSSQVEASPCVMDSDLEPALMSTANGLSAASADGLYSEPLSFMLERCFGLLSFGQGPAFFPTWNFAVGLWCGWFVWFLAFRVPGAHSKTHRPPKGLLPRRSSRSWVLVVAMVLWFTGAEGAPIAPTTKADRERVFQRSGTAIISTRAVKEQTRDKRKLYLDRFRSWLWSEKGASLKFLLEVKPPDPERISNLLIDYGRALYAGGKSYGIFSETINAIAVERPLIRRQLNGAWDLAFAWLSDEPAQHHPAMPLTVLAAMVTTALMWGWPHEAAVLLIGWTGIMRIGEVLAATRAELILPCDSAPGTTFALVVIRQPKTRGRSARHQAARIDQADVIQFLTRMYGRADSAEPLWPYSASTLRKRFSQLLGALRLPVKRCDGHRPFDLGSLRPGGATWLLHQTEQPELVRRRGRWLSARTMEIYLQEVLVTTFEEKINPNTRALIHLCESHSSASWLFLSVEFHQVHGITSSEVQKALSETSKRMEKMVEKRPQMPTTTGIELMQLPVMAAKRKSGYLTSGCQLDVVAGAQAPTQVPIPFYTSEGGKTTSDANNHRHRAHATSSHGGKKEERLPI